jgi:hypothetical protein
MLLRIRAKTHSPEECVIEGTGILLPMTRVGHNTYMHRPLRLFNDYVIHFVAQYFDFGLLMNESSTLL